MNAKQKFVYVISYWEPFPGSEYGGLEVYVAESDEQVFEMVLNASSKYALNSTPKHEKLIWECIKDAVKIPVAEDAHQTGLVQRFTT